MTSPFERLTSLSQALDADHDAETVKMRSACTVCGFMTAIVDGERAQHLITNQEIPLVQVWLAGR